MLIHFAEPAFISRAGHPRLNDRQYGLTLDNCVIACVDCAVIFAGQLLLGYRSEEPYKDGWWIMGGRMMPGESFQDTAQRILEREVGLKIRQQGRFIELFTGSFPWPRRAQKPVNNGCHMIGVTFLVRISPKEKAGIRLTRDFARLEWVGLDALQQDTNYHPSTRSVAGLALRHYPM